MAWEWHGRRVSAWRPRTQSIALGVITGSVAGLLLSGQTPEPLAPNPSILPVVLTVNATANALTAFMLFQQFLAGGRGRLIGLGIAYLWSLLLSVLVTLSYPGITTQDGLFPGTPSLPTWFGIASRVAFPVVMAIAFITTTVAQKTTVTRRRRRWTMWSTVSATTVLVAVITALLVRYDSVLPTLVINGEYTDFMRGAFFVMLGVNVGGLVIALRWTRQGTGAETWLPVVLAISLADLLLTSLSGARYTVGWYAGRGLSVVAAFVVLTALLVEFIRLYRKAEDDKRALEDEALGLLRENRAALHREDRVRRIIENAADAYVEIGRTGVVQAWNGKAAELFGRSTSEMLGKSFGETIMAAEGWEEFETLLAEFWLADDRFDGGHAELLVTDVEGNEFPVEATMWVDERDSEPHMSFFLRDITIRREAEERLQQALAEEREAVLRLQEIDRVKSDFVSSISHELRSPLTNTLGYLELLAEGDAGDMPENQRRMVGIAQRNAQRLLALIEDLLTLSRIEEGAYSVRFRPVSIEAVVQDVHETNKAIAAERDIELVLEMGTMLGICPGDAKQLGRALGNVVSNGVKFTPPGGKVTLAVQQTHDQIIVTVTDNGIGIPSEEQPKLFNRFFRTSLSVEQQHQGAGLGLTIAKAIVEHHGGTIDIQSTLGVGTVVSVKLPGLPARAADNLSAAIR